MTYYCCRRTLPTAERKGETSSLPCDAELRLLRELRKHGEQAVAVQFYPMLRDRPGLDAPAERAEGEA